jgi:hypothetical protein
MALQPNGAIVVAAGSYNPILLRFQGDDPTVSCGDADFSDAVGASDALLALRSAVGVVPCLPCLCNANASGATTAIDALLILRSAVGLDVELYCAPGC